MSVHDPDWKYSTAEESRKPGYLAKKFDAVRKRIRQEEAALKAERSKKVRPLIKKEGVV